MALCHPSIHRMAILTVNTAKMIRLANASTRTLFATVRNLFSSRYVILNNIGVGMKPDALGIVDSFDGDVACSSRPSYNLDVATHDSVVPTSFQLWEIHCNPSRRQGSYSVTCIKPFRWCTLAQTVDKLFSLHQIVSGSGHTLIQVQSHKAKACISPLDNRKCLYRLVNESGFALNVNVNIPSRAL
jgi:hypothetical protein